MSIASEAPNEVELELLYPSLAEDIWLNDNSGYVPGEDPSSGWGAWCSQKSRQNAQEDRETYLHQVHVPYTQLSKKFPALVKDLEEWHSLFNAGKIQVDGGCTFLS